jgi:BON domain
MPTDAQVLQEVIATFDLIPGLRSARLHVDVKSRSVTIRGRVHDDAERQEVERSARAIVGLRALVLKVGVARRATEMALQGAMPAGLFSLGSAKSEHEGRDPGGHRDQKRDHARRE